MTLAELIALLDRLPADLEIENSLTNPHADRGDYADLAFELGGPTTVGTMLTTLHGCVGQVFHGWKGGEYRAGLSSDVLIGGSGRCGANIAAVWPRFVAHGETGLW